MNPQALAIQMGTVPSPPHQQPPRAMGGMGGGAGEVTFGYSGNIPVFILSIAGSMSPW